jgi:Sulfotransferase family
MPLPNFLIIGAGRSGTTSLHHYLRQHPQVFMPRAKEPAYFAFAGQPLPDGPGADYLRRTTVTDAAAYAALFDEAGDARAIGEASPQYLRYPDVPARIQALIPEVRLVAILRHPVERMYSTYLAHRRDGYDPEPTFEGAIADQGRREREGHPFGAFLAYGFYMRAVGRFRKVFPRDRLRIYLYEDLSGDPRALLRDLFTYLDVDPTFVPDMTIRHGRTGLFTNPVLRTLWAHSHRLRSLARPVLPVGLRDRAYLWTMRGLERPPMRPETRASLLEFYREDTLALQAYLGRDLSAWLK